MDDDQIPTVHMGLYIREIHTQARFAATAFEQLVKILGKMEKGKALARMPDAFWLIHSFLTHAAMVSKLLSPGATKGPKELADFKKRRTAEVAAILEVGEISPVLQRTMRDHLEHFDERLDEWYSLSTHHNAADMNFGPAGGFSGIAAIDSFRNFDPDRWEFRFRDDVFNIRDVAMELRRIEKRADWWLLNNRF